jgi:hypothetical protein
MAIPLLQNRIDALRDRYERLSQRERTLVMAFFVALGLMFALISTFLILDKLSSLDERNADMRQALKDIDSKRELYIQAKQQLGAVESRIPQGQMQLGSFLETAAKEAGLAIPEQKEQRPTSVGNYTERSLELDLTRVKLDQLANFLRRVETGPQLVVVSALHLNTRDDKHQELDAHVMVTTWERSEKKDKDKDKKGKP